MLPWTPPGGDTLLHLLPSLQMSCCYATWVPGLPSAFPNPMHMPVPRTLAALGVPILQTPAPWQLHTHAPQALGPWPLWASQCPDLESSPCEHCIQTSALYLCIMGVCTSDTSFTATMRVPTAEPGAKRDPLNHDTPIGEKDQEVPSSLHH